MKITTEKENMNTRAEKKQDNKAQSVSNESSQKQSYGEPTFQFPSNRAENILQRRLQEIGKNSPQAKQLKAFQEMADNSHQIKRAIQLQAMADNYTKRLFPTSQQGPTTPVTQRRVNVNLDTDTKERKSISATGVVKDFKGGTDPGSKGWVGVTKYRARYEIEDDDNIDKGSVGPYKNTFTNPEAGHVLAKQNGGNGGDPENIFAQDGGTNNGPYKVFENSMRRDLNLYTDDANVEFMCYLEGNNIFSGTIADAGLSDASSILSDSSSDES